MSNRASGPCPQYAMEGVPTVSMRKEGAPGEWEDVFVFPDPELPGRRGFVGQLQEVNVGTNSMSAASHTWEGQGESFYKRAIGNFEEDIGALGAVNKNKNQVKTLQEVLDKLKKPGDDPDDSSQGGTTASKRKSTALGSGGESLPTQSPAESSKSSGLSKNVLGMFTSPKGQKSSRRPSPVASEPPSKASKSNATATEVPPSPQAHADSVASPGSPGGQTVASNSTAAFELLLGENDSGEQFLKSWKKLAPRKLL